MGGWGHWKRAVAAAPALLLIAAAAASAAPIGSDLPPGALQPVALVQRGHILSRQAMVQGAKVLAYQVNRQMRQFWPGPKIDLRVMRRRPPTGWPVVELVALPAPPMTAGTHLLDADGHPLAIVYLRKWRHNWTVGASHELMEMLQDPDGNSITNAYLEEICDPVQFVWYRLRGAYVADFATPAWYIGGRGPWDAAHHLSAAYSFSRGGEEDYHAPGGWTWIGPGAHMKKLPKPVKLGPIRLSTG